MDVPDYAIGITTFLAWQFTRQPPVPDAAAVTLCSARLGIPVALILPWVAFAHLGIDVATNLGFVPDFQPISEALAGDPQPKPTVYVRSYWRFRPGKAKGAVRTIAVEVSWTSTVSDVLTLLEILANASFQSAGSGVGDTEVTFVDWVPPIIFPEHGS